MGRGSDILIPMGSFGGRWNTRASKTEMEKWSVRFSRSPSLQCRHILGHSFFARDQEFWGLRQRVGGGDGLRHPFLQRAFEGLPRAFQRDTRAQQLGNIQKAAGTRDALGDRRRFLVINQHLEGPGGFEQTLNQLHDFMGGDWFGIHHIIHAESSSPLPQFQTRPDAFVQVREQMDCVRMFQALLELGKEIIWIILLVEGEAQAAA